MPTVWQDPLAGGRLRTITLLISPQAFSASEVAALTRYAAAGDGTLLVAPGRQDPAESSWAALLSSASRSAAISASEWAIDPPSDERPFFFLQLRPRDVLRLGHLGPVSRITMRGVQVLLLAAVLACIAALIITLLAGRGPRAAASFRLTRPGQAYFALLGIGYMAVQLGLHQRLSIVLGHPITTLALVLATMLLGTGIGSAAAGMLGRRLSPSVVLLAPITLICVLTAGFRSVQHLGELPGRTMTALGAGVLAGGMGLALGVALPTGVRAFARSESCVAEAWAINGAFSVVGSVLAAVGGLLIGSRGLLAGAIPCYLLASLLLLWQSRAGPVSEASG